MPTSTAPTSIPSSRTRKTLIPILVVLLASALYLIATESQPASLAMKKFLNHLGGGHQGSQQQEQQQQPVAPSYGSSIQAPSGGGKRNVGYFTNWGIYGRKFFPQMIPAEHLTHINYAFANVRPETGEVVLTDSWSDVEIHYEGDSWNEEGTNLYGNFKALYLLKQRHRNLKVLISIGGWSYKENFKNLINPGHRDTFVSSSIKMVEDIGLDGLDIDWEYPSNHEEAQAFVALLRECREGLTKLAQRKGKPPGQYQLTIAAPCGLEHAQKLLVQEMDQHLDFWNLMAYDFAGSWDSVAGHQAPLFAPPGAPSVDAAVQFYRSKGLHPSKMVIGIPAYGRAFCNTNGIGHPFNGVGPGTDGGGVWDYRQLPLEGAQVQEDERNGTSYSYDANKRELISYDTARIACAKARYIAQSGLGGAMFWELSLDQRPGPRGHEALVPLVAQQMGGLEWRENELDYLESKYENLRKHMQA